MSKLIIEEKIIHSEQIKFEIKWLFYFILISSFSSVSILIAVLSSEGAPIYQLILIPGSLISMEFLSYIFIKNQKYELAITSKGVYYKYYSFFSSQKFIDWNSVQEVNIKKFSSFNTGNKINYNFKNKKTYKTYSMIFNEKPGIEIILKEGVVKYEFSVYDVNEIIRKIKNLDKNILIQN